MTQETMSSRLNAVATALFVVFLWSTSSVLIKIGLEQIPALTFAGLRYMLAFICLLPFAVLVQRKPSSLPITRRVLGQLLALGLLLYTLTQGAVFLAFSYLPAVTVSLVSSFSTVTVALFGIIWLAEHPSRFQWVGVALAAFGAMIYFYPVDLPAEYSIGIVAAVVSVLAYAGAAIVGRDVNRLRRIHPLTITAISMGAGAAILLVVGISSQGLPRITVKGWAIIAWLAVFNTALAFTLWNYTQRTLSATVSSIINGTTLIWIPILAVVFLDEQVSRKELLGLIVAGVGTLVVQLRSPSSVPRIFRRRSTE